MTTSLWLCIFFFLRSRSTFLSLPVILIAAVTVTIATIHSFCLVQFLSGNASIPFLLECNIDCHLKLQKVKNEICIAQQHKWIVCFCLFDCKDKKLISMPCTITQSTDIFSLFFKAWFLCWLFTNKQKNSLKKRTHTIHTTNDNESALENLVVQIE